MNHFTVMKKIISQLEDILENIDIYEEDYMIGIRRDDLTLELAYDYQWSDKVYFSDMLGVVGDLKESITDIVFSLGEFFKSEDFFDHEKLGGFGGSQ